MILLEPQFDSTEKAHQLNFSNFILRSTSEHVTST